MTFLADANVRRLLSEATPLQFRKEKNEHPLGLGIPRKKAFQHPNGKLKLPLTETELKNLVSTTSAPVLDLDHDLSQAAWGHLLASPSLLVPLCPPTAQELNHQGIALDSATAKRLLRLGLVKVFKHPDEGLGKSVGDGRVAGVAALTLLQEDRTKLTRDAWLWPIWSSTTQGLSTALEWLLPLAAGPSSDSVKKRKVLVVLTSHWIDQISEDVKVRLNKVAHVFGFGLDIHNGLPRNYGSLETSIRQQQPQHVVILGPTDETSRRLIASFTEIAKQGMNRTLFFDLPVHEDPVPSFREHLATLAGLSHSLVPLPVPSEKVQTVVLPGTWEVLKRDFSECMHDAGERQYRREVNKNWWTKDTAKHGDSTFKEYRQEGKTLIHVSDYDEWGKPMPGKHKGDAGKVIDWETLHGCGSGHVND